MSSGVLRLRRSPGVVNAIFEDAEEFPSDFSMVRCAEEPPRHASTPSLSRLAEDQFAALNGLATNLYDLIALQGAQLGWSAEQIVAFQAPVTRIREAASTALKRQAE